MYEIKANNPQWEQLAFNVGGKVARLGKDGLQLPDIPPNLKPYFDDYESKGWITIKKTGGASAEPKPSKEQEKKGGGK